ncbi:hypothetical protein EAF04_000427 [Stromatinia cepivora]|nr:hypothetical protein EAF04_000427 [Stromatinia cepivora]
MTVLDPIAEASMALEDEIRQISELYSKLADIDINHLRASYNHKKKLDIVAAKKEDYYYKGINRMSENLNNVFVDGQKLLSQMKVSRGDIEVTLGTEDDQQNIDNAWEKYMKTQIDGFVIHDTDTTVEQRKEILKSIKNIRRFDWDTEDHTMGNRDVTSVSDTESAGLASDNIVSLELAKIKEELGQVQDENNSLVLENRSTRYQLENVGKERDALLFVKSKLTEQNKSLGSMLKDQNHPTHDINALVMATSLRFFNLSIRRNDFGGFTAILDRGVTDVDAIDRGSAAVHSGNVRLHAFLIHMDSNDQFKKYSGLFKIIYGVTALEVAQGSSNKYSFDSKNTEIANLRGSMAQCLSFSKLTHDRLEDFRFERLRERCEAVYQRYLKELGSAASAQKKFDKDRIVREVLIQLRRISKHTTWLERQRIQAHISENDSGSSTIS